MLKKDLEGAYLGLKFLLPEYKLTKCSEMFPIHILNFNVLIISESILQICHYFGNTSKNGSKLPIMHTALSVQMNFASIF